ncbi:hypothetical protein, conserved in T. vivax [Trypanosoma vivax Y486]|uniref:Uncharacterized protein n=1 Tax=Trypanosoma vivax (strain Y486) TaxID=1055687 RepID=F9WN23_TRYVY|nr:hypothetical protein, conserved in T. vivax [Trypanosoma vivax Y486]|eukprot:CCD18937.1 hypothetical protein, conserved in T. vivax [Trypanosoma vivax Y486]
MAEYMIKLSCMKMDFAIRGPTTENYKDLQKRLERLPGALAGCAGISSVKPTLMKTKNDLGTGKTMNKWKTTAIDTLARASRALAQKQNACIKNTISDLETEKRTSMEEAITGIANRLTIAMNTYEAVEEELKIAASTAKDRGRALEKDADTALTYLALRARMRQAARGQFELQQLIEALSNKLKSNYDKYSKLTVELRTALDQGQQTSKDMQYAEKKLLKLRDTLRISIQKDVSIASGQTQQHTWPAEAIPLVQRGNTLEATMKQYGIALLAEKKKLSETADALMECGRYLNDAEHNLTAGGCDLNRLGQTHDLLRYTSAQEFVVNESVLQATEGSQAQQERKLQSLSECLKKKRRTKQRG